VLARSLSVLITSSSFRLSSTGAITAIFLLGVVLAISLPAWCCTEPSPDDPPFARPSGGALVTREHYLFYRDTPLMIVGNNATQSVMQNLNFDYEAWLDDLAANQVRFAMIWSWMAVRQNQDGSIIDSRWGYVVPGVTPWKRSEKGIARDGLSHWDLNEFDANYWKRLEDVCRAALGRDILLLIVIFDGWAKDFAYHPFNRANGGPLPDVQDGRAAFAALFDYKNEVLSETFSSSWPVSKKNQYYQERFVDRLLQVTAAYDNVIYEIYNEGSIKEEYDRHFVEFVAKRTNKPIAVNDDYTPFNARRHPLVDIISWHTNEFDPASVNRRWQTGFFQSPANPIINTETVPAYYAGKSARRGEQAVSEHEIVDIVWATLTAAGGIFLQDDTVFAFDQRAPAVGTGESRRYLGYASRFLNENKVSFVRMRPGQSIIPGGLALVGSDAQLIYIPQGGRVRVDLSDHRDTYEILWYDPMGGKTLQQSRVEPGRVHVFAFPVSPLVSYIKRVGIYESP
jgi:hypothetical protein